MSTSQFPSALSSVRLTREQIIEHSVQVLVTAGLVARGYPQNTGDTTGFTLIESFPYGMTKLDTNLVAAGFNYDDGGRQFEIGSNMKERKYTLEFFIFGTSLQWAKSLAEAIKFTLEVDQAIALFDPTTGNATGEWIEVDEVKSHRQAIPEPEPWEEFVFCVTLTGTDWYTPSDT